MPLRTVKGTATTSDNDYIAKTGTLTFAPGETSKTITILVNGDRLAEPNETFVVNLSNPTNATIADGQGLLLGVQRLSDGNAEPRQAGLLEPDREVKGPQSEELLNLLATDALGEFVGRNINLG